MAKYIVQHRRGNSAQWAEKNTIIPREGEIVIEIDEENSLHKLKIGDGIHTYAELAYLMAGDEIVTQVLAEAKPRVVTVELTSDWNKDAEGKYSQTITLDNITSYSRLDLQPTADMLAEFKQLGLVFVTENNGGTITVYSVGNMPLESYTMQATIVETECDGTDKPVVGIPVGTPVAQSDWGQTDETKADYIKNKPTIPSIEGLATETYVDNKVASMVDSAPETLDTLNELAAALGDDPNFATTVATQIGQKADKTSIEDVIRYTEQSLTDEQKAQARENIGAISASEVQGNGNTTVELDTTLTKEGYAADAKAVGDALVNVEIAVDDELSDTSTNPVQNKVVKEALDNKLSNREEISLIVELYDIYGDDSAYRTTWKVDTLDSKFYLKGNDVSDIEVYDNTGTKIAYTGHSNTYMYLGGCSSTKAVLTSVRKLLTDNSDFWTDSEDNGGPYTIETVMDGGISVYNLSKPYTIDAFVKNPVITDDQYSRIDLTFPDNDNEYEDYTLTTIMIEQGVWVTSSYEWHNIMVQVKDDDTTYLTTIIYDGFVVDTSVNLIALSGLDTIYSSNANLQNSIKNGTATIGFGIEDAGEGEDALSDFHTYELVEKVATSSSTVPFKVVYEEDGVEKEVVYNLVAVE